jgi:hypothetical protein
MTSVREKSARRVLSRHAASQPNRCEKRRVSTSAAKNSVSRRRGSDSRKRRQNAPSCAFEPEEHSLLMFPGSVDHQVGVFPSKCFGDMTIPTNWPVRLQYFRQFFDGDFVPLDCSAIRIDQSRPVIVPIDVPEPPVTVSTLLPLVPFGNDRPHQTIFRGRFDLRQASLSAVLTRRPARALA